MDRRTIDRFFGGNPLAVLVKLAVISLVVGIVLAALNLDALQLVEQLRLLVVRIYEMGFDAIAWAMRYFLLGAVIVFPIWLVSRLWKGLGDDERDRQR